jgi:hypothetical protein
MTKSGAGVIHVGGNETHQEKPFPHFRYAAIVKTAFPSPQANVHFAHDSLLANPPWLHSFFHPFREFRPNRDENSRACKWAKVSFFSGRPPLSFHPV